LARKNFNTAKDLISEVRPKNKGLALLEVKAVEAKILAAEGELQKSANLLEDWIFQLPKPTGKSPSGNDFRHAGLAQVAVKNYDKAIPYLEKAITETEKLRSSFKLESRGRVLTGLTVKSYWGLIRSYAERYLKNRNEEDFDNALRVARMLRARQFGELLGLDFKIELDIDVTSALKTGEILLNIILTDSAIVVFVFSSKNHDLFIIETSVSDVNTILKDVKAQISSAAIEEGLIDNLQKLSQIIIAPIKNDIGNNNRIIVIPDGVLNGIPFTLLSKDLDSYRPLILDHEIVLSPSIAYLFERRKEKTVFKQDKLFAVADPDYTSLSEEKEKFNQEVVAMYKRTVKDLGIFSPLPETRTEVKNISALFHSDNVFAYYGKAATETNIKAHLLDKYRYIHFATHGILGNQIPGVFEPALVLSTEPENSSEDGFLTLHEVQQLKLDNDLTVLSACDTGSGKYYTGEGIMGLSRGFLLSGSRSVVVSLWPVASDATVNLMTRFYKNLRSGYSKASSLRKAQLNMMGSWQSDDSGERGMSVWQGQDKFSRKKRMHPFCWAPFVLIGD